MVVDRSCCIWGPFVESSLIRHICVKSQFRAMVDVSLRAMCNKINTSSYMCYTIR